MRKTLAAVAVLFFGMVVLLGAHGQEAAVVPAPTLPAEEIEAEPAPAAAPAASQDVLAREEELMQQLLGEEAAAQPPAAPVTVSVQSPSGEPVTISVEAPAGEQVTISAVAPAAEGTEGLIAVPAEQPAETPPPVAEVEELAPTEAETLAVSEELPPLDGAAAESELIELDVEKELNAGIEVAGGGPQKDLITISLDDVPLQDVVRMFTRISGANIVAGTNLQGNVTVSLQDVEWEPALRVILDSVDMAMVEKTPGIYSILSKGALASEPVTVDTLFLNFTTVSNVIPIARRMLVSSNASATAFSSANAIVIQETAAQIKNIKATIAKLDVPRPQVFIEAKFVELNDQAIKDLGINWQVLQGYTIGVSAPTYGYSKGRVKTGTTTENSARNWVETSVDRMTDSDTRTRTRSSTDSDIENDSVFDSFVLVNGVPSFLFEDTASDVENESDIDSDLRVRLDENFGQRTRNESASFTRNVQDSVATTTEELLAAVLTAEDFAVTLSALKQNNGVDIVSNPRIIVASGELATIHVGQREPNVEARPQGDTGNVYVYGLGSPAFFEVGVKLKVKPTVNTEERITVEINPELSRLLTPKTVAQAEITFPRIQTRTISTEFNVESGRTVAIGGLTQASDQEQISKIPVLGDIPIIGRYLFRHTHTETVQDEVIIFVTVGLAGAEVLTEVAGVPTGGRLIHKHLAREALQRQ